MLTPTLPAGPDALTADWLSHVLRESGTLVHSQVASFEQEHFANANSQLLRLTLHYDDLLLHDEQAAPTTLIAKFPSADPVGRSMWSEFNFYRREIGFYQECAKTSGVRTPLCYYSALDTQSGDSLLLLEDLAPGRTWIDVTYEEATLAIREIAKLHARWWGSKELVAMTWLPAVDSVYYQHLQDQIEEGWESFLTKQDGGWPPEIVAVAALLKDRLSSIVQRRDSPQTVTHCDYHSGNMFFDAVAGKVPLAIVDWEFTSKGCGPADLGRLLATLPVERRREEERPLLRLYHAALLEHGVTEYSFAHCFDDYRMSMLEYLARGIIMFSTRPAHPVRTRKVMIYSTAVLDLHAGEFLA